MPKRAYTVDIPTELSTSVVFASPHSGRDYPDWFLGQTILTAKALRSSEDAYVDRLFDVASELGAPFLRGAAPRAFVDYNRSAEELDPALIAGIIGSGKNPRVASGLGVIPRVVAGGRPIYHGKLQLKEAQRRIETYWRPYHDKLQTLLNTTREHFGEAILIDCHSMPHEALDSVRAPDGQRPNIVLGDRFGAACRADITDHVEAAFIDAGFSVSRNSPFAGAYIAQHYGRPSRNQHALQIEIDRSLYMDEPSITPHRDFQEMRRRLQEVVGNIVAMGQTPQQLAAE